jgi:exonuclease I
MGGFSFWHAYETFGVVPRRDRPAQFAGIRTDAALNEIGAPVMLLLDRRWSIALRPLEAAAHALAPVAAPGPAAPGA